MLRGPEAHFLFNAIKANNLSEATLQNLLLSGSAGLSIAMGDACATKFDVRFVNAIPLADLLRPLSHVDLLDMDIQGAEVEVLGSAMAAIDAKVKRAHVGMHGQDLHDATRALFVERGWRPVFDFAPQTVHRTSGGAFETQDGILAFGHLRLLTSQ
ncbi:MAG: FkbM family methyltransferase [Alphaproteobacteria bacterium]|nr:FkbM family methyltransferase [Alphaproteobacteria bacterium]